MWSVMAAGFAYGSFHTWVINELYSNSSGTIQFIEFRESAGLDGQNFLAGHALSSTHGAIVNTFVFPTNLPVPASGVAPDRGAARIAGAAAVCAPASPQPVISFHRGVGLVHRDQAVDIGVGQVQLFSVRSFWQRYSPARLRWSATIPTPAALDDTTCPTARPALFR
jgi:hypothetical protein